MSEPKKQTLGKRATSDYKLRTPIPSRILEGIRNGDELAFAEYYEGIQNALVAFVARLTGDPDEALNIAHDALIKLWEQRERIDQLNGFVYTTATNASLDLIRKRGVHDKYVNEQKFVLNAEVPAADESLMYNELQTKLDSVIENMPPQRRKVFQMSRDENLTYDEIAERLGISYNAVMKQIQLALKDFRNVSTSVVAIFFFEAIFNL